MNKKLVDPVPANVTVTILGDDPADFQLESNQIPILIAGSDYVLEFNNGQNGIPGDGYEVTFTINDQTGYGYGFFQAQKNPSPNDAISVKVVDSSGHCPSKGAKWPGFNPTSVTPDRQNLVVSNPNKHLQYFGFALYFSLEGETTASLKFDPIGDNQDGLSYLY
jgi:hypothetical protein